MSSKRKADAVDEGGGGGLAGQCLLAEKHNAKKHITLQHSQSDELNIDTAVAVAAAPVPSPAKAALSPSAAPPSSPHTAPLPAEVLTPLALDDGLLASLTLSPAASRRTRQTRPQPSALSLPSSPASARRPPTELLGKRNRAGSSLSAVPPLQLHSSLPGGDAHLDAAPVAAPAEPTHPAASSASPSVRADVTAKAERVNSPAEPSRSSTLHAHNLDSAIRGMQGISLSSLSSASASTSVDLVTAATQCSSSPRSVPPSASVIPPSPPPVAPRPLPLIRLTLSYYSGVRRTNSSDSAQGNLKKHKRSALPSSSPMHSTCSSHKDSAAAPNAASQPPEHAEDREGQRRQRKALKPTPHAEDAAAHSDDDAHSVHSSSSTATVGQLGAERERDEEEASVGSLETALSASSIALRSSSPSTSVSSTMSACTSSSSMSLRCDVCNKELSSAAQLEDHQQGRRHQHALLMRQSGGSFACEPCLKVFTSAADQEKHFQSDKHREIADAIAKGEAAALSKASVMVLACELCGVTFTGLTQQRQHLEGKKHLSMVRDHERQIEGKEETAMMARRKREDSKGRDEAEVAWLSQSKKRKFGRSSPAVQQQQPSPTPRHIQPHSSSPPTTQHQPSAVMRVPQTIRYITPPPQVPPTTHLGSSRRSSSRSVSSAGSEGSQSSHAEQRTVRMLHPQPQHSLPQASQLGHEDGTDSESYSSSVSSYEACPTAYDYASATFSSRPAYFYPPPPPLPPQFAHVASPPSYPPGPLPPFSDLYQPAPASLQPSYLQSPLPAPMFAYLSPAAAAALQGPFVPSLTPITVLYPTELLLSQHYAHPYAYPPLYVFPPTQMDASAPPASVDGSAAADAGAGVHVEDMDSSAPRAQQPQDESVDSAEQSASACASSAEAMQEKISSDHRLVG